MAIIKKNTTKLDTDNVGIIMLLYGAPGTGKTTLACSADKAFVLDCDKGIKRVNVAHRADYSDAKTYTDILADVDEAKSAGYETLVIDTVGALLDAMTQSIIESNPKVAQADGTLTLKAYGTLKNLFLSFSAMVRQNFKNTIFVCHEYASRDGDNVFYDLVVAGSTKQLLWQPVDLGARLHIRNTKRYLGFTPTEEYNAKSSFGIKGLIEVPELDVGDKNDFLSKLFARVRENIAKECEVLGEKTTKYEEVMKQGKELIAAVTKPEDVQPVLDALGALPHELTSDRELKSILKKKLAELNITFDKNTKTYCIKE